MTHSENKPLQGKVAVVAGATRGAGRGIAVELGAAGATVYCTGRSVRGRASPSGRPETIDGTAERVTAAGGVGMAVQTDHLMEDQVKALFARVAREQDERLDILVNDIWGGEDQTEWGKPSWETDAPQGLAVLVNAVHTHLLTSRWGVPLMVARGSGLIIEVGDGTTYDYRGELYYSLAKVCVLHTAQAMAADLSERGLSGITALFLTPGYLRSEGMLDHWGMTEEEYRPASKRTASSTAGPSRRTTSGGPWPRWRPTRTSPRRAGRHSSRALWWMNTGSPTWTAPSPDSA